MKIIRNARIKNVGQYEPCMVYQLRIILKRARIFQMNQPYGQIRDSGVCVVQRKLTPVAFAIGEEFASKWQVNDSN